MNDLSEAELALLRLVGDDHVAFSRGRYFILRTGQPSAPDEIHTLRARGLVVLRRIPEGQRRPPTQMCMTTEKADALLEELADAA